MMNQKRSQNYEDGDQEQDEDTDGQDIGDVNFDFFSLQLQDGWNCSTDNGNND